MVEDDSEFSEHDDAVPTSSICKPSDSSALMLAKNAIDQLIEDGYGDKFLTLMAAASEYVNTMLSSVRSELRNHIAERGGSTSVDPIRLSYLREQLNPNKYVDKTIEQIEFETPTTEAIRYDDINTAVTMTNGGVTYRRCNFPVGVFDVHNPSHNLCCGEWYAKSTTVSETVEERVVSCYCPRHSRIAVQPGTALRKSPAVLPPSRRANLSLRRGRRTSGVPGFDSY